MNHKIRSTIIQLAQKYPKQDTAKHQTILEPHTVPEGIYILTEGNVRMFTVSKEGIELTLNIFKPISFFPMNWVLNDTPNHYYFDTLTPATIHVVPKPVFENFLGQHSEVVYDLLQRVYRGLDGYLLRVESLLAGDAYFRIVTHLVEQTRRFGPRVQLTHQQLATLTGLTRETVTREIKKLLDKGIVLYEGKLLTIPMIEQLEAELSS